MTHSKNMDDVKLNLTSPTNITDISSYQTVKALTLKGKDLVNNELLNTFTAFTFFVFYLDKFRSLPISMINIRFLVI